MNVAGAVLDGRAAIFSAEDLRFTRKDGRGVLRREAHAGAAVGGDDGVGRLAVRAQGVAQRDGRAGGAAMPSRRRRLSRTGWTCGLFAGLGTQEREFLLDIGLFEWIDAALLDDAASRGQQRLRARSPTLLQIRNTTETRV